MSEIKKYRVKIRCLTEYIHEQDAYAGDEDQACAIALKIFHDTIRDSESKSPKVIEIKEVD